MPPGLQGLPRSVLSGKRKTFDEQGCRLCGSQRSSSFRRCLTTGHRLCNSCHCKLYRRKRKEQAAAAAAERAVAGHSDGSTASAAALPAQELGPGSDGCGADAALVGPAAEHGSAEAWAPSMLLDQKPADPGALPPAGVPATAAAAATTAPQPPTPPALTPPTQPPSQPPALAPMAPATPHKLGKPHPALASLQWRVLEEEGLDVATTLQCAHHAQAATAGCIQRTVLGVLPRLDLRLPNDPPGMRHAVSCLIEAVQPVVMKALEQEGDSEAAAGAAAKGQAPPRRMTRQQQRQQLQARLQSSSQVVIRMTVFGAAGAVARWHQAPAIAITSPVFNPMTGEPTWNAGLNGFCLCFPGPGSPQVELFNAIRVYAASVGAAALLRPTLELGPAAAARPTPFAAPMEEFSLLLGEPSVGEAAHWALSSPLASQPTPRVDTPAHTPPQDTPHPALLPVPVPLPQPACSQLPAQKKARMQLPQVQQSQQTQQQAQQAEHAAQEWQSLQALLLQEQEPSLQCFNQGGASMAADVDASAGVSFAAAGMRAGAPDADAGGFSAGAVDADPLACLGLPDDLSLSCSLPSEPLFDASCLDFLCTGR